MDSGPGVKDPSRVFDPFYTTKPVGKGTGLGLSICYGIITEHGGSIRVKNVPEQGAVFRIELPLRSNMHAQKNTEVEIPRATRCGRILVVDANDSVLETVGELLSANDHAVTTSKSLAEARQLVAAKEFDLVVADWQMVLQGEVAPAKQARIHKEHGLGPRVLWTTSVSAMEKGPWLIFLRMPPFCRNRFSLASCMRRWSRSYLESRRRFSRGRGNSGARAARSPIRAVAISSRSVKSPSISERIPKASQGCKPNHKRQRR